jgi:hypothetical protein
MLILFLHPSIEKPKSKHDYLNFILKTISFTYFLWSITDNQQLSRNNIQFKVTLEMQPIGCEIMDNGIRAFFLKRLNLNYVFSFFFHTSLHFFGLNWIEIIHRKKMKTKFWQLSRLTKVWAENNKKYFKWNIGNDSSTPWWILEYSDCDQNERNN